MSAAQDRDRRIAEGAALYGKPLTIALRPATYDMLSTHSDWQKVIEVVSTHGITFYGLSDE